MEKTRLIHTAVRVYYHYQFVYKLVYYNNKSDNPVHAPIRSLQSFNEEQCPPTNPNTSTFTKDGASIRPDAGQGDARHCQQSCTSLSICKTVPTPSFFGSTVEKPMNIHRIECVEQQLRSLHQHSVQLSYSSNNCLVQAFNATVNH